MIKEHLPIVGIKLSCAVSLVFSHVLNDSRMCFLEFSDACMFIT